MSIETMVFSIISAIVAIVSLAIAFSTWLSKQKKDDGEEQANDARIMTKLDFISEDVKDVKAECRSFREELSNVQVMANRAKERADAAHERIDRIESGHV